MNHNVQKHVKGVYSLFIKSFFSRHLPRPVDLRATAGPGNHYCGALSVSGLILYALRSREQTLGWVFSHHPTRKGSGERRKLPQWVRVEPRPKMDFMHVLGQKEATWNNFSVFLSEVNSAFHPSEVGKSSTDLLARVKAGHVHLCRVAGNTVRSDMAGGVSSAVRLCEQAIHAFNVLTARGIAYKRGIAKASSQLAFSRVLSLWLAVRLSAL